MAADQQSRAVEALRARISDSGTPVSLYDYEARRVLAEIDRLRLLLQRCLCTMDADYHAPLIADIAAAGVTHICSEAGNGK